MQKVNKALNELDKQFRFNAKTEKRNKRKKNHPNRNRVKVTYKKK